jgi:hypothetical protein
MRQLFVPESQKKKINLDVNQYINYIGQHEHKMRLGQTMRTIPFNYCVL